MDYNLIKDIILKIQKEEQIDDKVLLLVYGDLFGYFVEREKLLKDSLIKNQYLILIKKLKVEFEMYNIKVYKLIDRTGEYYLSFTPGEYGGNKKLKIYGKLNCSSANRWIEKGYYVSNRVFFKDEETAIEAGYRPCAICMPNEYSVWKVNQEKVLSLKRD